MHNPLRFNACTNQKDSGYMGVVEIGIINVYRSTNEWNINPTF